MNFCRYAPLNNHPTPELRTLLSPVFILYPAVRAIIAVFEAHSLPAALTVSPFAKVLDHPHVYAVADKAHRFMTNPMAGRLSGGVAGRRKRDQSIIITGESGAGKTEAAK